MSVIQRPARQLWMEPSVAPGRPASRAKRGGLEGRPGPFGGFAPSFASPNYRCSGTPWAGDWQRGAAAPFATSRPGWGRCPQLRFSKPSVPWRQHAARGAGGAAPLSTGGPDLAMKPGLRLGPAKPHSTSTWKSDRYGPVAQELTSLREGALTGAAQRSGQCRGPALMEKKLRGATCALR
jgi:hypothetical protein